MAETLSIGDVVRFEGVQGNKGVGIVRRDRGPSWEHFGGRYMLELIEGEGWPLDSEGYVGKEGWNVPATRCKIIGHVDQPFPYSTRVRIDRYPGMTGTVRGQLPGVVSPLLIELDEDCPAHFGWDENSLVEDFGLTGRAWLCFPDDLSRIENDPLAEQSQTAPKLNLGDRVRYRDDGGYYEFVGTVQVIEDAGGFGELNYSYTVRVEEVIKGDPGWPASIKHSGFEGLGWIAEEDELTLVSDDPSPAGEGPFWIFAADTVPAYVGDASLRVVESAHAASGDEAEVFDERSEAFEEVDLLAKENPGQTFVIVKAVHAVRHPEVHVETANF